MRWPGKIPAGTVQDEVCSTMDLLPMFAHLAGAPLPDQPIDGRDVTPRIVGKSEAQSHWDETGFFYYRPEQLQAVRSGKAQRPAGFVESPLPLRQADPE